MNKMKFLVVLLTLLSYSGFPQMYLTEQPFANTFSVVARDPVTGELGAAVQSHWFNVGAEVIWGARLVLALSPLSLLSMYPSESVDSHC